MRLHVAGRRGDDLAGAVLDQNMHRLPARCARRRSPNPRAPTGRRARRRGCGSRPTGRPDQRQPGWRARPIARPECPSSRRRSGPGLQARCGSRRDRCSSVRLRPSTSALGLPSSGEPSDPARIGVHDGPAVQRRQVDGSAIRGRERDRRDASADEMTGCALVKRRRDRRPIRGFYGARHFNALHGWRCL